MAIRNIRARYQDGRFEPLEPVELEEGCEVDVQVDVAAPEQRVPSYARGLIELQRSWPKEMHEQPQIDRAKTYRDELYGRRPTDNA